MAVLHVGIAGAGIGGLTAGLALAQAGCRVSIFERTPDVAEVGAGLQLSPNASSVLQRLGVLERVRRDAVAPDWLCIGRGQDGAVLARLPLGRTAEIRFGAPFLVTLRADLHGALLEKIRREPRVGIETGASVAGWREHDKGIALRFADLDRETVLDALVGCDGLHSAVRDRLSVASGMAGTPARRTAWRATLEASATPAPFCEPRTNLWLGHRAHLVHYPVAGGKLVNVVATVDDGTGERGGDFWSTPGDPAELQGRFASWADPIRRFLALPQAWRKWPLTDRPPLASWSRGPVTLLGDAAHPMLPFLAQGAAQAIEDAWALGLAVQTHPLEPAAAFRAYEAARLRRTARVQAESRRQAFIYHLPAPASSVRDLVLRLTPADRLLARYDWLYAA